MSDETNDSRGRNPNLTRDRTREAAYTLLARGKWPSRTAVRAITRRGSPKDIENYLREYFLDIARLIRPVAPGGELLATSGLSSEVIAAVYALLDALRDEALEHHKADLVSAQQRIDDSRRQASESDRARAKAENDLQAQGRELQRLEEHVEHVKRQLEQELSERRKLERRNVRLQERLQTLIRKLVSTRKAAPAKKKSRKKATANGAKRRRKRKGAVGQKG